MSKRFCHLHVHTGYSLLDSMVRIESLVKKVAEDGQTACAITDHGTLAGIVKFTEACKKRDIKPIIGEEFYIAPDSRFRKKYARGEHSSSHLILLAKTARGWDNLRTLSTLAYTEGFYRKPRIDHELLARHSEGLICTTACMGSDIAVHLMAGLDADGEGKVEFRPSIAAAKMAWYASLFGDDFYIELQDHGPESTQAAINEWYRERYAPEKTIATADCHYLNQEDYDTHDTLLCCNTVSHKHDVERWRFPTDQCWLKTHDEMAERFYPHELENTQRVADSIEFELPLRKQWFMPELPDDILSHEGHPGKILTSEEIFHRRCWEGLCDRLKIFNDYEWEEIPHYRDRLNYEIEVFQKAGFIEYALILWDLMRWCREQGIMTGDGRGSGAGSLVLFALGVVNVDPIARNCPFERFINPGRIENFSPPDVDLDFPKSRRQEVLSFLRSRYGDDRCCHIGTYSTFGAAKIVKKLQPVLGLDMGDVTRISAIIPEGESSLQGAGPASEPHGLSLDDVWNQSDEFRKIIERMGEMGAWLLHYARGLRSLGTHSSTHASGLVIASRPVAELVPLMVAKSSSTKEEITLAQLDMFDVEALGLVKFDILGLETLDVLADTERAIRATHDADFSFDQIDLDDPAAYDLLAAGRTTGIFQASGGGFGRLLPQAKPRNVEDLAVLTSLCRPGPSLSGDTEVYLRRRQGVEAVTYDIPELEALLAANYGVLAFQEDIMNIAHRLAGFTLAEADELRKVMGKKQIDKMPKYREKFISGLEMHSDISPHVGDKLWEKLVPMAQYVFNRSHAMAYSYTTAKCAYAKAHYPAYFIAAAMTAEISGTGQGEDLPMLVRDAQIEGCHLLPPDINNSEAGYVALDPKTILLGLLSIKGVGPAAVEAILAARTAHGPFSSIEELRERVPPKSANKAVLANLVRAGAFDDLGHARDIPEDQLAEEFELFGFHLSGHPCLHNRFAWQEENPSLVTLQEIIDEWKRVRVIKHGKYGRRAVMEFPEHHTRVLVTKLTKKKSKKTQGFMLMLDIEDETNTLKMIVNEKALIKFGNPPIKKGSIIDLIGKKSDPDRWAGYFDASSLKVLS